MLKLEKLYPRDIIALVVLIACFILMYFGIDSFISFVIIMVITFYFSRRFDGEGEPKRDLTERIKKVEEKQKIIPPGIPPQQIPKSPGLPGPPIIIKPSIPS